MRTRLKKLLFILGEIRARRRARSRARERRVLAIGRTRRAFRTPGGAAVKIGAALVFAFGCGISLGIGIAAIADRSWGPEETVAANSVSEAKPISEPKPAPRAKAKEKPVYSVPVRVRRLPPATTPQADPPDAAKALPHAVGTPAAAAPPEPSVARTPEPADNAAAGMTGSQRSEHDTTKASIADRTDDTDHTNHAPTSLAAELLGGPKADDSTTSHAHNRSNESLSPSPLRGHVMPDAAGVDATDPLQGERDVVDIDSSVGASVGTRGRGPELQTESLKVGDETPIGVEQNGEAAETGEFVVASLPPPSEALWIRNAVETPPTPGDAMIAIIIDDMGIDQKRSRRAIEMAAPLTLSFIPYGYHLHELTAKARAAGHEVMLHLPMEPLDPEANPGPNALLTQLAPKEILRRLRWGLDRFGGYVGVNNHMGSKFTAWRPGMKLVMNEIRSRGLMFLDSWTNNRSVGLSLSKEFKVPSASRDIFIDHDISRVAIKHSLAELEYIARRRGFAVGIGHPHDLTLEMLARWVSDARSRGIDFVPISAIVRRSMKSG